MRQTEKHLQGKMKEQVEETVCGKIRSRDGRETVNISNFPPETKWNPPLIGQDKVFVCVRLCVCVCVCTSVKLHE